MNDQVIFNKHDLKELLVLNEPEEFVHNILLSFKICNSISKAGGRALFVGGIVRDLLLKIKNPKIKLKDIDIEVFRLSKDKLINILSKYGKPHMVGASFGIIKINDIDFSLPRKDSKTGEGHKGFEISIDPFLSYAEAARRRSFTITSIGLDPLTGEILDPYRGKSDLEKRILRVVDPDTFAEDSLRVLRGMQFIARFNLKISKDTLSLCKKIKLTDISEERIGEEWMKLLLLSEKPSIGLEAAVEMGVLKKLHKDTIHIMIGIPQEPEWHPEGDVWQHTKNTVDAMVLITQREKLSKNEQEILILSALLHDIGKADSTEMIDGKLRSFNHHRIGLHRAELFMKQIRRNKNIINSVLKLIEEHLFLTFTQHPTPRATRRLSVRLRPATIDLLAYLIEADMLAQHADKERFSKIKKLRQIASELDIIDSMPEPLITGKYLLSKGFKPGPNLGQVIDHAYSAQLNGDFDNIDGAIVWYEQYEKDEIPDS